MTIQQMDSRRLGPNAGIAIGPILFIIAILAILAAAIAASSGSFTNNTTNESNRTKSSALVEIGDNLKVGMDRITMDGGVLPLSVVIDPTQTSGATALFGPTGGGIAPPSVSMANNPVYDKWYYPTGYVKNIGTGGGGSYDILAVLPVSAGVCAEINNRTQGQSLTPATAALGDFTSATAGAVTGGTLWSYAGLGTGCVETSSVTLGASCSPATGASTSGCAAGPTSQYFFYQVIAIQ